MDRIVPGPIVCRERAGKADLYDEDHIARLHHFEDLIFFWQTVSALIVSSEGAHVVTKQHPGAEGG